VLGMMFKFTELGWVDTRLKEFWVDDALVTNPIFVLGGCAGKIFAEDGLFCKIFTPPVTVGAGTMLILEDVWFDGTMFMFEIDGLFGKILIVDVGVVLVRKVGCCLMICGV